MLDVNSGAVHVVDELAYEAIALYEKESAEEIVNQLQDRYPKEEKIRAFSLRRIPIKIKSLTLKSGPP